MGQYYLDKWRMLMRCLWREVLIHPLADSFPEALDDLVYSTEQGGDTSQILDIHS